MRIFVRTGLLPHETQACGKSYLQHEYYIYLQLDDHVISYIDPSNDLYQRALYIETAIEQINPDGWIELDELACVLLKDYLDRLEYEAKIGSFDKALRLSLIHI